MKIPQQRPSPSFFSPVFHFIPFPCSVSFILVHLINLRYFFLAMSHAEMFVLFFKNVLKHFHGYAHHFSAFRPNHVSVSVHSTSSWSGLGKGGRKGHVGHLQAEAPETTTESSFISPVVADWGRRKWNQCFKRV